MGDKEENWKRSSKREVKKFFAHLVIVVIDLISQSHFFVKAIMGLNISGVVSLAISRAVLTGMNIAIGFSELSLW